MAKALAIASRNREAIHKMQQTMDFLSEEVARLKASVDELRRLKASVDELRQDSFDAMHEQASELSARLPEPLVARPVVNGASSEQRWSAHAAPNGQGRPFWRRNHQ